MSTLKLKASLLPKQAAYVTSTSPVAMYAGGVGAGKTISNIVLILRLALDHPGIEILVCAPTYAMLRDTVMREFKARCPRQILSSYREGIYPEAVFCANRGRQSTVRFRSFDDPGKPKGITVGAAIIDEVTEMREDILDEIMRRIRQEGMPNYLRMTTNSDSKQHYVYTRWVEGAELGSLSKDKFDYIHTTSFENVYLPANYLLQLRDLERTRPAHYLRSVMGLWGDFSEGRIGPFSEVDNFSSLYKVAFIDTSYSDRRSTDRTAVSIVSFEPHKNRDNRFWPIVFTGKSWEKSITDPEVISELLLFLDRYKPIESCLESQLGDSTNIFIDRIREAERSLGLSVKNHWTYQPQTKNKHERIMYDVAGNKDRMFIIRDTDSQYVNSVVNYAKGAAHEDEIDSLASAVHRWQHSSVLSEFIRRSSRRK